MRFPSSFYVDPDDYRPGFRKARQGWLRIPVSTETGIPPGMPFERHPQGRAALAPAERSA